MKNNTKPQTKDAGRVEVSSEETADETTMDRTQILRSIREAYRSGRPVESVMHERMAMIRSSINPHRIEEPLSTVEYGRSVYRKRKCGKVASFFRCLLR